MAISGQPPDLPKNVIKRDFNSAERRGGDIPQRAAIKRKAITLQQSGFH